MLTPIGLNGRDKIYNAIPEGGRVVGDDGDEYIKPEQTHRMEGTLMNLNTGVLLHFSKVLFTNVPWR